MSASNHETTCPICNVSLAASPPLENCPQCGAMLAVLDGASLSAPASQLHRPVPVQASNETFEIALRVAAITLATTLASALLAATLLFLVSPLFDSNPRVWLLAAAYFGGLIGFLGGFLWTVLGLVERKFLWGLALGGAAGLVAGGVNFLVLRMGDVLPEVEPTENFVIGLIAGPIAGLSIALFRDRS